MLIRSNSTGVLKFGNDQLLLIKEADDAFYANDKADCVEIINQIYDVFDEFFARHYNIFQHHT